MCASVSKVIAVFLRGLLIIICLKPERKNDDFRPFFSNPNAQIMIFYDFWLRSSLRSVSDLSVHKHQNAF